MPCDLIAWVKYIIFNLEAWIYISLSIYVYLICCRNVLLLGQHFDLLLSPSTPVAFLYIQPSLMDKLSPTHSCIVILNLLCVVLKQDRPFAYSFSPKEELRILSEASNTTKRCPHLESNSIWTNEHVVFWNLI